MHRVRLVFFLLILVVPLWAQVRKPVSLQFTTNDDGMVIVPITLGNAVQAHVFIDTGAGLDVFAPSLIEKAHGRPTGQFTGFRENGERLDLPLFVIPELRVGPIVRKNALVGSWAVFDKMHFDGIISMSDFRHQPFTFDFPHKQVVFESEKSLQERLHAGDKVPLKFDDFRGIALDMFGEFEIGGKPGLCELDTGSPGSIISTRYMAPLGIDENGKDVEKKVRKNIAGVTTTSYGATVPEIALAAAPGVKQVRPKVEFSDIIYDCAIGIHFWSGRPLTVDIPQRELVVGQMAEKHR